MKITTTTKTTKQKKQPKPKIHLIFRAEDPKSGDVVERHFTTPTRAPDDRLTHVFTLHVNADATFSLLMDGAMFGAGSLLNAELFAPPFQPPAEIADPTDEQPEDWVTEAT